MSEQDDKDARIKQLEARVKALELKTQAPPKVQVAAALEGHAPSTYRLIDQMGLPPNAFDKLVETVPDKLVREVMEDRKRARR